MTTTLALHGSDLAAGVGAWLAGQLPGSDGTTPRLAGQLWTAAQGQWTSAGATMPAPLTALVQRFQPTLFELECVLACLAAATDGRVERVLAPVDGAAPARAVDVHRLLTIFAPAAEQPLRYRRFLLRDAHMVRSSILNIPDGQDRAVRLDEGVLRFLLDEPGPDPELVRLAPSSAHPAAATDLWRAFAPAAEAAAEVEQFLQHGNADSRLALFLTGRAGAGQRYVAEVTCAQYGFGLLALDARRLTGHPDPGGVLARAFRDAALYGSPLLLEDADALADPRALETLTALQRLQHERGWLLLLAAGSEHQGWFPSHQRAVVPFPELTRDQQRRAWLHQLETGRLPAANAERLAETMAAKFRLSAGEIALTWEAAARDVRMLDDASALATRLHEEASVTCAPVLGDLARKVEPIHRWADIVLPDRKLETLRDVVRQVAHRRQVMEQWGFERTMNRSLGLNVLFSGVPGTGKTMAAEILSAELQMDLFRINLAAVVSKYIGETEKNLARIFSQAENANVILFFDEADALFGRRSEVKDAHDRYANIEVNYLLQQMETYRGVAILATNCRQHLDEAFLRRMHIALDFPQPSADERLRLWERCLPPRMPRAADIDFRFLAERFELTGANIQSIALTAAYLAADARDDAIRMATLVQATQRELEKTGKRLVRGDFGPYAVWLERASAAAAAGRS